MPKISALEAMITIDEADQLPINDVSATQTKRLSLAGLVLWLQAKIGWITTAMLANNAVTSAKIEVQQAWQFIGAAGQPAFQNLWRNYTTANPGDLAWDNAAYMKDSLGFVHLQGLVASGTIGAVMFTLPAGYRPAKSHLYAVNAGSSSGRVDVRNDGTVFIQQTVSNSYVGIGNIIFKAEL